MAESGNGELTVEKIKDILGNSIFWGYLNLKTPLDIEDHTIVFHLAHSAAENQIKRKGVLSQWKDLIEKATGEKYLLKFFVEPNSIQTEFSFAPKRNTKKEDFSFEQELMKKLGEMPYLDRNEFVFHQGNRAAFNLSKELIEMAEKKRSWSPLVLIGESGTGKTAAFSYAARKILEKRLTFGYLDFGSLSSWYQRTEGKSKPSLENVFESNIVFLDSVEVLGVGNKNACKQKAIEIYDNANQKKTPLVFAYSGGVLGFQKFWETLEKAGCALGTRVLGLEKIFVENPGRGREDFIRGILENKNPRLAKDELEILSWYFQSVTRKNASVREIEGNINSAIREAENQGSVLNVPIIRKVIYGKDYFNIGLLFAAPDPEEVCNSIINYYSIHYPEFKKEDILRKNPEGVALQARDFIAYALSHLSYLRPKYIADFLGINTQKEIINSFDRFKKEFPKTEDRQSMLEDLFDKINDESISPQ